MIYTATEGVDRQVKERVLTAQLILLPLLMLAVTAYGMILPRYELTTGSGETTLGATLGTNTETSNSPAGDPQSNTLADDAASSQSPAVNGTQTTRTKPANTASPSSLSPVIGGRGGESTSPSGNCPCQIIPSLINDLPSLPSLPSSLMPINLIQFLKLF